MMTMGLYDDLDVCAGCNTVEPPQRVSLDAELCDVLGCAGPGIACARCAEIARDKAARDALEVLCAQRGCEWALDLTAPRPTVTLHRRGVVIGRVAGDTLADAVRAHEEVLAGTVPDRGPVPRGAIEACEPHPLLRAVAYRTKRAGFAAESVGAYLEAAALDPNGVAVRMWETDLSRLRPCDLDAVERKMLWSVVRGTAETWLHIGPRREYARALDELEACGLVTTDGGRWCVTAHGREIAEEMGR
jgi:hypothetical protein